MAGVRSPPLGDEAKREVGRLASKNPETTRRAVFSEGRTLCVRIARPCVRPYVPLPEVTRRVARGLMGTCLGQAFAIFTGVRSPPLRDEANPNAGRPAGDPRDDAKGDLLGGAHSVRPQRRARGEPRHVVITWGVRLAGGKKGGDLVVGVMVSLRACGARPSATGPTPTWVAWRDIPEMTPKAVFSEGRTLCVRKDGPGANQGMSPSPRDRR